MEKGRDREREKGGIERAGEVDNERQRERAREGVTEKGMKREREREER